jgi:uncharacterized protein YjbI with pentapeptide repeats
VRGLVHRLPSRSAGHRRLAAVANQEHVEILKKGVKEWNAWRSTRLRPDLRNADLTGAKLLDANLWSADLTSANLASAILDGAVLDAANLTFVNLTDATLMRAAL